MAVKIRPGRLSVDFPLEIVADHVGFVVGHGAGFRGGYVGGVPDDIDPLKFFGLQSVVVGFDIPHGVTHAAVDDHLGPEIRRDGHQKIIGYLLASE